MKRYTIFRVVGTMVSYLNVKDSTWVTGPTTVLDGNLKRTLALASSAADKTPPTSTVFVVSNLDDEDEELVTYFTGRME